MHPDLRAKAKMTPVLATAAAGLGLFALAACGLTFHATSVAQVAQAGDNLPSVRQCQAAELSLTLTTYDKVDDHTRSRMRFTSTAHDACRLAGYPAVSYVAGEDAGQIGASAKNAFVSAKTAPGVTLRPGMHAYAYLDQPSAGTVSDDECQPTAISGLRVFPPDGTESLYIPMKGTACATSAAAMTVGPITSTPNAVS